MEVRTQQSGRIEDVSPLDLLQSLGIYRRPGHVVFIHAQGHDRLWFEAGEIVDAEAGALRGAAAVYRIVTHERGEFRVEVTGEARARTIEGSASALIFEAARRLDEGQRLRAKLPGVDAVLSRVATAGAIERSSEAHGQPSEAHGRSSEAHGQPSEAHGQLFAQLEVGVTLGELLERSALGELETLQWIAKLVESGTLRATGAVRSPVGHALVDAAAWHPEPSQTFVSSPSYATPERLDEVSRPWRRWWIHASVGAALAAMVTLAILWSGTEATTDDADAFVTMAGALVARADVPATASVRVGGPDTAARVPPLAVGSSEATQRASVEAAASPASPEPLPSITTGRTKPSRASDSRARSRTEPAPAPAVPLPSPAVPSVAPDDADALLAQARRAYAEGRAETAYRLATRSQRLVPTGDAAELMTLSACRLERPEAAAEALRAVPLLRRGSVRSTCKQVHGVQLKASGPSR